MTDFTYYSQDSDLQTYVPDITSLGIGSFTSAHLKAFADINRELRVRWWDKKGIKGELNPQLLTQSQFTRASAYLVLWQYALPQLTTWVDGDRFVTMIDFYKARYGEEIDSLLRDGIEYDANNDNTVTEKERESIHSGRLAR